MEEAEEELTVSDVCCKHNYSQLALRWKAKSEGTEERENSKLKKMTVPDQALYGRMLKDVNNRKWWAWQSAGAV